jgi:hypothetical protein
MNGLKNGETKAIKLEDEIVSVRKNQPKEEEGNFIHHTWHT